MLCCLKIRGKIERERERPSLIIPGHIVVTSLGHCTKVERLWSNTDKSVSNPLLN